MAHDVYSNINVQVAGYVNTQLLKKNLLNTCQLL